MHKDYFQPRQLYKIADYVDMVLAIVSQYSYYDLMQFRNILEESTNHFIFYFEDTATKYELYRLINEIESVLMVVQGEEEKKIRDLVAKRKFNNIIQAKNHFKENIKKDKSNADIIKIMFDELDKQIPSEMAEKNFNLDDIKNQKPSYLGDGEFLYPDEHFQPRQLCHIVNYLKETRAIVYQYNVYHLNIFTNVLENSVNHFINDIFRTYIRKVLYYFISDLRSLLIVYQGEEEKRLRELVKAGKFRNTNVARSHFHFKYLQDIYGDDLELTNEADLIKKTVELLFKVLPVNNN